MTTVVSTNHETFVRARAPFVNKGGLPLNTIYNTIPNLQSRAADEVIQPNISIGHLCPVFICA